MGKFYDAMQKVSPARCQGGRSPPNPRKPTLPELDEALLDAGRRMTRTNRTSSRAGSRCRSLRDGSTVSATVDSEIASLDDQEAAAGGCGLLESQCCGFWIRQRAEPVPDRARTTSFSLDAAPPHRRLQTAHSRLPTSGSFRGSSPIGGRRAKASFWSRAAVSGEGTSTVARNIALALAQHRAERVLLIDANLRTPSQHTAFGLEQSDGLGDVLLGPKVLDLRRSGTMLRQACLC